MPSREISALIAAAEKLDITHADPMLLIADENEQRQRLFTDFRGASVSASGGLRQRVAVAGWEGAALVVETTMIGGKADSALPDRCRHRPARYFLGGSSCRNSTGPGSSCV
jgi:hypothetical protein